MKVLIDSMVDGIEEELGKHDYEAYSVKKLCEEGMRLQSDFSIMKYAEANNMVLVTEDIDNIDGCKENGMDYVEFGRKKTVDYLLSELEKIKFKRDNA